ILINSSTDATWTANGTINVGTINVQRGGLVARNATRNAGVLNATTAAAKTLDLTNTTVPGLTSSTLNGAVLTLESAGAVFNLSGSGPVTLNWTGVVFGGKVNATGGNTTISGGATIADLSGTGGLTLLGNSTFGAFRVQPGAAVALGDGTTQSTTSTIEPSANARHPITLSSPGAGSATLSFDGRFKRCFDFLAVTRVGVDGDVVISAGANSTLNDAANWAPGACGEALFADFSFKYNCEGSLTEFTDTSDGNIISWSWDFGDPTSGSNTSTVRNPFHIYNNTGTYSVTVTVSDGNQEASYTRDVPIINNDLPENTVIIANQKLFSKLTAEFYQWFMNGELLESETARAYEYGGEPGSYVVVIKTGACNLPSPVFVITAAEPEVAVSETRVYPNPVTAATDLNVEVPVGVLPANVTIINTMGQVVFSGTVEEDRITIPTGNFS